MEENAESFERMRESVTRWNEETTEENARDLWLWLWWWSGSSEIERGTEHSPSVGEIGWRDENGWNPIPLVHRFPLALPLQYDISVSRWHDGEWETIVGTRIGEYTRSDSLFSRFGHSVAVDGRSTFPPERISISARLPFRIARRTSPTSFWDPRCHLPAILGSMSGHSASVCLLLTRSHLLTARSASHGFLC